VVCEGRASERAARGSEVAAGCELRTLNFELRALMTLGFERDGLQAVRILNRKSFAARSSQPEAQLSIRYHHFAIFDA